MEMMSHIDIAEAISPQIDAIAQSLDTLCHKKLAAIEASTTNLRNENERLSTSNRNMQEENTRLIKRVAFLTDKANAPYQGIIHEKNEQIDALDRANEQLRKQVAASSCLVTKERTKRLEKQNSELFARLQQLTQKCISSEKECDLKTEEVRLLDAKLKDSKERETILSREADNLNEDNHKLFAKLQNAREKTGFFVRLLNGIRRIVDRKEDTHDA